MSGERAKGGKKNRKYGRNKKWCEQYKARGMREINKAFRLMRHLRTHEDAQAVAALKALPSIARDAATKRYNKAIA